MHNLQRRANIDAEDDREVLKDFEENKRQICVSATGTFLEVFLKIFDRLEVEFELYLESRNNVDRKAVAKQIVVLSSYLNNARDALIGAFAA